MNDLNDLKNLDSKSSEEILEIAKQNNRKLTPEENRKLIKESLEKLISAGNSYRECARQLGYDKSTIKNWVRIWDLTKPDKIPSPSYEDELRRLYLEENLSCRDIADKLGKSKTWAIKQLKKYGITDQKDPHIRNTTRLNRIKATNLERYGSPSPFGDEKVREKALATFEALYGEGVKYPYQIQVPPRTLKIVSSKENLEEYLKTFKEKPTLYDLVKDLGITHSVINKHIKKQGLEGLVNYYPTSSKYEVEIKAILKSWDIEADKTRSIISPYEIDLYNPDYKIGIEFNGSYWHSEKCRSNSYQQMKSKLAEEQGVFLYHIFEYEWQNPIIQHKILNQLKNLFKLNTRTIYARKCEIREVGYYEAKEFLDLNHLQGSDKSPVRLGLYYENELVALMTFCKPRFNKNYDWELGRFCCLADTNTVGGASKLFKYFLKNYNPKNIISYSDIAKTQGGLYSNLGFKLQSISKPNYVWYANGETLTRYKCQKYKLVEKYPQYKDLSETQIMESLGYIKVHDCGNKVWVYQNP